MEYVVMAWLFIIVYVIGFFMGLTEGHRVAQHEALEGVHAQDPESR